ncbi:MAG: MoxR family ATPase, partial [Desulfotomaculales bacterium]
LKAFYWLRGVSGLQKKPSTSELLDWIQALVAGGIPYQRIAQELPFLGVLLKKNQDFELVLRRLQAGGGQKQPVIGAGRRGW